LAKKPTLLLVVVLLLIIIMVVPESCDVLLEEGLRAEEAFFTDGRHWSF
jgi:hypothetical protein